MTGKKRTLSLMMIVIILTACDIFSNPQPQTTMAPGEVLFMDNFDNPDSGWTVWTGDEKNPSLVNYQGGGMRILVARENFDYWSTPGKSFRDVSIQVQTVNIGIEDDNSFGVLCRYQDNQNFYALVISSDGYAGIIKVKAGVYELISGEAMDFNKYIRKGMAVNDLKVDCVGPKLSLTVNNHLVIRTEDGDFEVGDVGVIAGSNSQPGVDIFFDDFIVKQP